MSTLEGEDVMSLSEKLIQATKEGNVNLVKSLLGKGADATVIYNGWTALEYAEKGGHTEVVTILKRYAPQSAGGRLLLFCFIPIFGINFICGLYVFLKKKKTPNGEKIYKYTGFSRILAMIGVVLWAIVIILSVTGIIKF